MDVIESFKNGAWLNKAKNVLGNKQKIRELLIKVSQYISKEGLSSVRKELESASVILPYQRVVWWIKSECLRMKNCRLR